MRSGGQGRIWHSGQAGDLRAQGGMTVGWGRESNSGQRRSDQIDADAGGNSGERLVKYRYFIRPSGEDKRKPASMKAPDSPEPLTTDVLMN